MTNKRKAEIRNFCKRLIEQRVITRSEQLELNGYYEEVIGKKIGYIKCGNKLRARIMTVYSQLKAKPKAKKV
jgi:hypothetical protein